MLRHNGQMSGEMPLLFVAAAALVDADGRVLIAQRPPQKSWAGYWEFPGGKIETGETPEAALLRELQEELGIAVALADLSPLTFASHSYDDFHLFMPLYLIRAWRGEVTPREHVAIAWARAGELPDYQLLPADLPLIAPLAEVMR